MRAFDSTTEAASLMTSFAARTGLSSGRAPRRYLWTDAFAVCNYLELARATGEERWRALALDLVDQVHHTLGRHRPDDGRAGWISGASDADGAAHPTRGGLRIGKPLPERRASEPIDPDLEWERDGQYFHYLTKWMHALDQVARSTRRPVFHAWARELASAAHRTFSYGPSWDRRMIWKASIDGTRPLVRSMGQHDALDGFVTSVALDATAAVLGVDATPSLAEASADFASMLERVDLPTSDPLGLGGLLFDAARLAQAGGPPTLVAALLQACLVGLRAYVDAPDLRAPAHRRLAFRELGLAIGLSALPLLGVEPLARSVGPAGREVLAALVEYAPIEHDIVAFWREDEHRRGSTWIDHADINEVMLATSLVPKGFLLFATPSPMPRAEGAVTA